MQKGYAWHEKTLNLITLKLPHYLQLYFLTTFMHAFN